MTLRLALPVTAALGLLSLMAWIGAGLAGRLGPAVQAALLAGAACAAAGLAAALAGRPRLAVAGWTAASLVLLGLYLADQRRLAPARDRDALARQQQNQALLDSALARVACANGDIATLQMLHNPGTERHSLSIQVVPADRTAHSQLLVSASGQYKPPGDEGVRAYLDRTRNRCEGPDGLSMDGLMARVRAHHEAERPKYEK